jgi:hypothetical protein
LPTRYIIRPATRKTIAQKSIDQTPLPVIGSPPPELETGVSVGSPVSEVDPSPARGSVVVVDVDCPTVVVLVVLVGSAVVVVVGAAVVVVVV